MLDSYCDDYSVGQPCTACGTTIEKASYLGGAVYYCPNCQKGAHCYDCEIRACGMTVGVVNCAHCPDYACSKLESFFNFVPDARLVLDEIRAGLMQI